MARVRGRVFVLASAMMLVGCKANVASRSAVIQPRAVAASSFDVIVAGPFAFVEKPTSLEIWIPEVEGHNRPFGVGIGDDQVKSFEKGVYNFTSGVRASQTTKLVTPVTKTSIYQVSQRANNISLSAGPKKPAYLTISFPIPREIVPWNADPIQIADSATALKSTPVALLSTMVVLRFDYQTGDSPQMTGNGQTWIPRTVPVDSERAILLGVNPPDPTGSEDEHVHAQRAFKELTRLLGIKRAIEFPLAAYTRNRPIIPGAIPDALFQILGGDETRKHTGGAPSFFSAVDELRRRSVFGKTNDCKAAAILVSP